MTALDIDRLKAHVERRKGGALDNVRAQAMATLEARGLPTPRHEDWKYTDLSELGALSSEWLRSPSAARETPLLEDAVGEIRSAVDADWLVIANGNIEGALSAAVPGIRFDRLSASTRPVATGMPLTALNAALIDDGLTVHVQRTPARPIGLLFVDDASETQGLSQVRVDIDVEEGQRVEIVEYYLSVGDKPHYVNAVLSLSLGPRSEARHTRVQARRTAHSQTQRLDVSLGRDSRFETAAFDLGGRLTRNDLAVDLTAPGATARFDGVYIAGDGQHVDNHTRVDHRTGPTASRQEYRGILFGRSRAVWNGKAMVHEGADGTDAAQANHNILLSENAEIDTKPELEIYAEDVRAAHGTTVGQLDERALFYLRSRGIDSDDARRLLVHAFAAETVRSAPVTAAREHIESLFDRRLADINDVSLSV